MGLESCQMIRVFKQTKLRTLKVLKVDSKVLSRIEGDFRNLIRARSHQGSHQKIEFACFSEELPCSVLERQVHAFQKIHSLSGSLTLFRSFHSTRLLCADTEHLEYM